MIRLFILITLLFSFLGFSQNTTSKDIRNARKQAKRFLRKQRVPGMSVSVGKNGAILWSEGFGYAKRKPKVRINPSETLFRIASISKSITALTLAKLVEDGIINLDESIYKYLPSFPKKAFDFSVRELGGHIAGIRSYRGNEFNLNKKMSITEGVNLFKNDSLLFEPSTQFYYNTFGYVLLSEIMQKSAHTDFYNLVETSVLKPLNMRHTTVEYSNIDTPHKSDFYRKKRVLSAPVSNEYKVAGGGFLSTSEDLVKFGQEIINPTLISKNTLAEIITSQKLTSGNNTGYGIGFSVEETQNKTPKIYHTGGGVGASTVLLIYPEEELVICILCNKSNVETQPLVEALETIYLRLP